MAAPPPNSPAGIDHRSGFDKLTSTFHSKRRPIALPTNPSLDVTTFISSCPHRGSTAYIDAASGRRLSFLDLWRGVDSLSSGLSSIGISKGDVVLVLSPNSILFPIVCLSVMSLGAIITTTNPLNTAAEISKQVSDSGPILAFTTRDLVPKLADLDLPIVLIDGGDAAAAGKVRIVGELEKILRTAPSEKRVKERVNQDDTATLLYSSGTTGVSKGVVSSHRNLIAMAQTVLGRFQHDEGKSFICTVPMFHIYGLSAFAVAAPGNNSTVIVLSKFSAHDMLSAIDKYRATYLPLVPPIMVDMVNAADQIRAQYDLSSLQWVISGGAPLSKEVIEGFTEKYPAVAILQGYGLTESTGIGATTDNLEESRRYGTAGMLSGSMEAKVVDPVSGAAMGVNQKGELWLRGPCIMKGYFGNAEATAETLDSDGWLRTGDLCYIDEDGFIFVVDRLKELIKYKGYQVAPAELEALLLTHPEIADAAVIPFPDKKVGQYPMAYVVRKEGSHLSGSTIMEFIGKQVATYKRVRRVAFIDSVPKNPSGKILRKDLIQLTTSKL